MWRQIQDETKTTWCLRVRITTAGLWQESTDLDMQVIEDRQKDGFKHSFIRLIDQTYFR